MIKENTIFLNGRKIGTYEFFQKAGIGHINFNGFEPYESKLTDDQQVVLNQLCQIFMKQSYKSKMQAVYIFINKGMSDEFLRLDRNESNQVLAAFAEWGMEQEGD